MIFFTANFLAFQRIAGAGKLNMFKYSQVRGKLFAGGHVN